MVIAVYADLKDDPSPENLCFLKSFIENFAITYPKHKFFLIVSNAVIDGFDEALFQVISLSIQLPVFNRFRLEQKVLKTLKVIKAERLFSVNTVLKTPVLQSVFFDDVKTKKKFSSKTLQKLNGIFVLSESEKAFLLYHYKLDPQKIKTIYGGYSKLFASIPDELKKLIKEKIYERQGIFYL